jgi:hypothetical protein
LTKNIYRSSAMYFKPLRRSINQRKARHLKKGMRRKTATARFMVDQATDQWPIRAIGKQNCLKQHVIIDWKESTIGRIDGCRMKASRAWETTQESTTRSWCQQCRGTATAADSIDGNRTTAFTSCIQTPNSIEWCRGTESVGCFDGCRTKASRTWGQTKNRVHFAYTWNTRD